MFMSDISSIVRQMRVFADRNLADQDIGFPEQLVLMHLSVNSPCNQESIALRQNIDKGAIAKTVAKLEEKGLVKREVNPANKREKLVTLLPAADAALDSMRASLADLEKVMFAGLTQQEIDATCAALSKIEENLSKA